MISTEVLVPSLEYNFCKLNNTTLYNSKGDQIPLLIEPLPPFSGRVAGRGLCIRRCRDGHEFCVLC